MHRLLTAFLLLASLAVAQQLDDGNYEKLRGLILPSTDELAWQKLGWRPTLWAGVVAAHEEKRPIVLWAMNGHPCGHT